MQAKMEPGNINICQLSPTVQATRSNYTQVHKGKQPLFLDYFRDRTKAKVLVERKQSEQGARFLKKWNWNVVIEVEEEIDLPPDYCWLTLNQIKQLLRIDNFVNMDARSILSCIPFADDSIAQEVNLGDLREDKSIQIFDQSLSGFTKELFVSMIDKENTLYNKSEIIGWFTKLKNRYKCDVKSIPLKDVKRWQATEREVTHETKNFFTVIAASVQAESREVPSWTQPMVKQATIGTIGFLVKKINDVPHILVQGKVEAGYRDVVEMAPTVSFSDVEGRMGIQNRPPFAEFFTNATPDQIRFSVLLSEEGGRFYHAQNRYMVIEIDADRELEIPENYIWMTLGQLSEFTQYEGYVNVESRSLLSCLKFL